MMVGATAQSLDARASFSNYGACLDLFAPGQDIPSAFGDNDNQWSTFSGTSMASAHVAGVAALFLENHPEATPEQVKEELLREATPNKVAWPGANTTSRLLYAQTCTGGDQSPPQVSLSAPIPGSPLSGL
jgi:subtilisin family serine protease